MTLNNYYIDKLISVKEDATIKDDIELMDNQVEFMEKELKIKYKASELLKYDIEVAEMEYIKPAGEKTIEAVKEFIQKERYKLKPCIADVNKRIRLEKGLPIIVRKRKVHDTYTGEYYDTKKITSEATFVSTISICRDLKNVFNKGIKKPRFKWA